MKTRNGFVSNSSSSSFCIYGASVSADKVDEEKIEQMGLEVHHGDSNCYEGSVYVGRSWSGIKDDETGAQFKKNVEGLLKELLEINKCSTIEESWYNG